MYVYKSRFLTRGEVWFEDEPDSTKVDWIFYRQRPKPLPQGQWKYFYTVLIDLAKSIQQLRAEMNVKTLQKISDSLEKDHISWRLCETKKPEVLNQIEKMWNESAVARKTALLDREWLEKLVADGVLEISATRDHSGNVLTYHLSYIGHTRAQDLIVVSPAGALTDSTLRKHVNHANCLGHWQNILAFRARGMRQYDFGGWYPGSTDIRLLGMNAFKQGFGGKIVQEYAGEEIRTLKGWAVLTAARFLRRTGVLSGNTSAQTGQAQKMKTSDKASLNDIWPATEAVR